MGQNHYESIDHRSHLQSWIPHETEPNIFVNRLTHEQVQRHSLKIPAKDISRESALMTARMNCYQLYICRLFYFHPAGSEHKGGHYSDREMLLYTDKMQPVKDWSRERIKYILIGLKRLVASYGPFRVCENNIKQNQRKEIRVWISENPAKNHPDLVYKNEESIVSDLAVLLSRKNQETASLIIGSRTLKQAFERFQQASKQIQPLLLLNSRKVVNTDDINSLRANDDDKITRSSHRNAFGLINQIKERGEHSHTPTVRKLSSYPNGAVANKQLDLKAGNSKYSEGLNLTSNLLTVPVNGLSSTRYANSRCKDAPESTIQYKKPLGEDKTTKSKIHQVKTETIYTSLKREEGSRNTDGSFMSASLKSDPKFILQHHRFETMQNLTHSKHYEEVSKPVKVVHGWNTNDQHSTSGYESKEEMPHPVNSRGEITIINNNVNNYVTNIIHNHIGAGDKKVKDSFQQFKVPPRPKPKEAMSNQNIAKEKDRSRNIPFFIQEKTKTNSHQTGGSPSSNKSQSINDNKVKLNTTTNSNFREPFHQFHQYRPTDRQGSSFTTKEAQKNNQLQINAPKSKDQVLSPPKYNSFKMESPYPKKNNPSLTPTSQNASFHKNNDSIFEVKNIGRTKTAEYYQKVQISKSRDSSPNRGPEVNQIEERQIPNRKKTCKSIYEIKQSSPKMEESSEYTLSPEPHKNKKAHQDHPQAKMDFKKQLKQEFKCLLGNDTTAERQEIKAADLVAPVILQLVKQTGDSKEGEVDVREKIKKKQLVFAELKKEALKVLTGD